MVSAPHPPVGSKAGDTGRGHGAGAEHWEEGQCPAGPSRCGQHGAREAGSPSQRLGFRQTGAAWEGLSGSAVSPPPYWNKPTGHAYGGTQGSGGYHPGTWGRVQTLCLASHIHLGRGDDRALDLLSSPLLFLGPRPHAPPLPQTAGNRNSEPWAPPPTPSSLSPAPPCLPQAWHTASHLPREGQQDPEHHQPTPGGQVKAASDPSPRGNLPSNPEQRECSGQVAATL